MRTFDGIIVPRSAFCKYIFLLSAKMLTVIRAVNRKSLPDVGN